MNPDFLCVMLESRLALWSRTAPMTERQQSIVSKSQSGLSATWVHVIVGQLRLLSVSSTATVSRSLQNATVARQRKSVPSKRSNVKTVNPSAALIENSNTPGTETSHESSVE